MQEYLKKVDMKFGDLHNLRQRRKKIDRYVAELRIALETVEMKNKERIWLRNQVYGDIDDSRIIDGITGERNIYKRRGEKPEDLGLFPRLPKHLIFAFDVSASMSRYNAHDGRLERSLEVALMIMDAFKGFEHKFRYSIVGHSGDSSLLIFVKPDNPPKSEIEMFQVLQQMHAHATHCVSGDNTMNCLKKCIRDIRQEQADDYIVVVISDANIIQYGIDTRELCEVIIADPIVGAFIVFIGSLHGQAEMLKKDLPQGHGFVCMETLALPGVMKQIFASIV